MGYVYFDDSKHPRAGFSLGAFVCCDDNLDDKVHGVLKKHGLVPGSDEFKSSTHMGRNPVQAVVREDLLKILQFCRLGVVVAPYRVTPNLGKDSLILLEKMLKHGELIGKRHEAYFDQSIFRSKNEAVYLRDSIKGLSECNFHFEQDSRRVAGIQLADLAAHACAVMLMETLGVVTKTVKAGERLGYEPNLDIEIGFELWAYLRCTFLAEPPPVPDDWDFLDLTADVKPYGLHVSDEATQQLREASVKRFGSMYLGCAH